MVTQAKMANAKEVMLDKPPHTKNTNRAALIQH